MITCDKFIDKYENICQNLILFIKIYHQLSQVHKNLQPVFNLKCTVMLIISLVDLIF
jgi:hypothetical protein